MFLVATTMELDCTESTFWWWTFRCTCTVCIYIYIYEWLYPFAGGRSATPVSRNEFQLFFQNAEKLFSHFRLTSSSCQDQMRLLVPHKSCRCYSHFCTTAKHSALTLCQAFCAMLQQRELEFFCKERHHLRSIKDVFMCKERHHLRSIKDVFTCKERHHPHPTPPQCSVASKMCFMCKERHHLRSIKDVFRCKERHHPHPTPPQTTPLWPPANGYNHGYIYIVAFYRSISYLMLFCVHKIQYTGNM